MDSAQDQFKLLSHFDHELLADDPVADGPARIEPWRGIGWVLKWAAAAAVLVYSTTVLTEFTYSLAAERMLARAAKAGAVEATLPRATPQSVERSVRQKLAGVGAQADVQLVLLHNSMLVGKRLAPRGGDRLTIVLKMPARALMPVWLRTLTSWRRAAPVEALAERIMPGRHLAARP